jgi:hypothetical protein
MSGKCPGGGIARDPGSQGKKRKKKRTKRPKMTVLRFVEMEIYIIPLIL